VEAGQTVCIRFSRICVHDDGTWQMFGCLRRAKIPLTFGGSYDKLNGLIRSIFTMTITIDLPPEIEKALRRRAKESGQDLATIVCQFVTESLEDEVHVPVTRRSPEEIARWLDKWAALHPQLDHPIDDSRESFYVGREE